MIKKLLAVLVFVILLIPVFAQSTSDWGEQQRRAIELFNNDKPEDAIILFREIISNSNNQTLIREGYFWLAKALITLERYEQAWIANEFYITRFRADGQNIPEAYYQKARILFLTEEFNNAVENFNYFIENFPNHAFISNAYYWIGESLLGLGHLDDAAVYFNIVIQRFPNSNKMEPSLYKLRLIDHKKAELALQNLLKWSQEQYISALTKFRIRERTLEQAISELSSGQSNGNITQQYRERIAVLEEENSNLRRRISEFESNNTTVSNTNTVTNAEIEAKLRQLQLKERLLLQKEEALRLFELELREKERRLAQ